ncbi:DNA ligase 4-like [Rosa chinensis]|uniref:DNA ligase 4-like n=1 Tax=Rosa chinensis TaxID=74649 RepID=UPI001AD91078|nr:DNA ligase 4-like [Rosa chinensis]
MLSKSLFSFDSVLETKFHKVIFFLVFYGWKVKGIRSTGANGTVSALELCSLTLKLAIGDVCGLVPQRRQGLSSGGLMIKELNDLLDRLASGENRALKLEKL